MDLFRYSRKSFLLKSIGVLGLTPSFLTAAADQKIYVVQKGDTLSEIASRYKTSVRSIKANNNLKSDLIKVGQKLIIKSRLSSLDLVVETTNSIRVNRSKWKYIVAHHSAIERGNAAAYDRNHRQRGMENGLAYHFVIGNGVDSGDGEIEIGERWLKQLHGGHVRNHKVNQSGIGICLVGNFEKKRPTKRQIESLTALVNFLDSDVITGKYKFMVHKEVDVNHTVCPGRYFPTKSMHRRFG